MAESAPACGLVHEPAEQYKEALDRIHQLAWQRQQQLATLPTIASPEAIRKGLHDLPRSLPSEGYELGLRGAMDLLLDQVVPTLAAGQAGPRYFGFVTGGTLPSAQLADMVTTLMDANVQVHLPTETLSTVVEKYALDIVLDAMHMDRSQWTGTFTTGATASNLLALACGRQFTVQRAYRLRKQRHRSAREVAEAAQRAAQAALQGGSVAGSNGQASHSTVQGEHDVAAPTIQTTMQENAWPDVELHNNEIHEDEDEWDPSEDGYSGPDVPPLKVFVCQAHASIVKCASILGIGRRNVIDLGNKVELPKRQEEDEEEFEQAEALARAECLDFDLARLESALAASQADGEAAIVVVGMGEVVTGALTDQTLAIRLLCDRYGAWLHMDAAFSAFVCLDEEFGWLSTHMGVCDSLTTDGHKTLNVPYDCGILYVKKHAALREATRFIPSDESRAFMDHACPLDDVCGPSARTGGPSYLTAATPITSSDREEENGIDQSTDLDILAATLPSPLHRNLENSRRFRALPVYISMLSQGHLGLRQLVERNLTFAARVRNWLRTQTQYQVLTPATSSSPAIPHNGRLRAAPGERNPPRWEHDHWATTVVLFRAHPRRCTVPAYRDPEQGHLRLIEAIKATRLIYVSPGGYCGLGAVRLAVSNWYTGVDGDRDFDMTVEALTKVMQSSPE